MEILNSYFPFIGMLVLCFIIGTALLFVVLLMLLLVFLKLHPKLFFNLRDKINNYFKYDLL